MLGRHSLKFGLDIRYNRLSNRASFDSKGTWVFPSLQEFMNNQASSLMQAVNDAPYDARQTNQSYFFQDDFRARKNLTFNLGIRYEYSNVPLGFFGAATDEIAAAGSLARRIRIRTTGRRALGLPTVQVMRVGCSANFSEVANPHSAAALVSRTMCSFTIS